MENKKILVAEDNTELSDMVRNYLLKAGHSVYQAFDGLQAIDLAKAVKPDLILLDIMMPICDGFEVCETVRKFMNVPIIKSPVHVYVDPFFILNLRRDRRYLRHTYPRFP